MAGGQCKQTQTIESYPYLDSLSDFPWKVPCGASHDRPSFDVTVNSPIWTSKHLERCSSNIEIDGPSRKMHNSNECRTEKQTRIDNHSFAFKLIEINESRCEDLAKGGPNSEFGK